MNRRESLGRRKGTGNIISKSTCKHASFFQGGRVQVCKARGMADGVAAAVAGARACSMSHAAFGCVLQIRSLFDPMLSLPSNDTSEMMIPGSISW